jgi:hypothetical protein
MIAQSLAALFVFGIPLPGPTIGPEVARMLARPVPALPEIGRVRAISPACAIMHDLIIPAFTAARRADDRFAAASKGVPAYAYTLTDHDIGEDDRTVDKRYGSDVDRQLSNISQTVTSILRETQAVSRALGDPRFASGENDPKVVAEREQLQSVYDAQMARASILSEFVTREGTTNMGSLPGSTGLNAGGRRGTARSAPDPARPPIPVNGQPDLNGLGLNDASASQNWMTSLDQVIHVREFNAANTFIDVAKDCH